MWNRMKDACPAGSARTGVFLPILAAVALAGALSTPAFAADPADDKPAPPADSQKKPPAYTDDDLEKYHKPKPGDAEPVNAPDAATAPAAVPAGGPVPAAGAAPPGPAKPASKTGRVAAKAAPAKPPAPLVDPTAPWKMKDARAAFRQDQIKQAREKLQGLESRLDYLKRKKDSIQNPVPAQVGRTVGPAPPDIKPDLTPDPKAPRVTFFPSLPPPQTDQDGENDKKMKLGELLASVEEEIKGVESDIEDARRDLVTIETRFAQESAQP